MYLVGALLEDVDMQCHSVTLLLPLTLALLDCFYYYI